jgi:hypothetical protein
MATNTPNFNLLKPDLTDNVDIDDLNGNMDIIDTELQTIIDSIPSGGGGLSTVFLLMGA